MYDQLAHLYDWSGSQEFAAHILQRDEAVFAELGLARPARILDLACGTGTLAWMLAQSGHGDRVIGLDRSEAMLTQARQKQDAFSAPSTHAPLWISGDMRDFTLPEPVDAVLCHSDSLNHLSNEAELRAVFQQVHQALKPGGGFLFDLNTLENYRTFWNGSDTDDGPNYRLKTASHFDEEQSVATATFQAQEYNDDGELLVTEESIVERFFPDERVERLLREAGFREIRWQPFNPVDELPDDVVLKTFWRCVR